jgi:hypothetical protein
MVMSVRLIVIGVLLNAGGDLLDPEHALQPPFLGRPHELLASLGELHP